jgi:hypothetical protein
VRTKEDEKMDVPEEKARKENRTRDTERWGNGTIGRMED